MYFVLIDGAGIRDASVTSVYLLYVACGQALMAVLGVPVSGSIPYQGIVWSGGRLSYQTGAIAVVALASTDTVDETSAAGSDVKSARRALASLGIAEKRGRSDAQRSSAGVAFAAQRLLSGGNSLNDSRADIGAPWRSVAAAFALEVRIAVYMNDQGAAHRCAVTRDSTQGALAAIAALANASCEPGSMLGSLVSSIHERFTGNESVQAGTTALQEAIGQSSIGELVRLDRSAGGSAGIGLELQSAVGGQVLHPDGTLYRPGPATTNYDGDGGDNGDVPGLDLGTTSGLDSSESTALTIAVGAACGILLIVFIAGLVAYAMHVASGADGEAEEENQVKSTSTAFVSDEDSGSAGELAGGSDPSNSELAAAGNSENSSGPAAFINRSGAAGCKDSGEPNGASSAGSPVATAVASSPSSPLRSARLAIRRIRVRSSPGTMHGSASTSRSRSRSKHRGLGVLPARSDLKGAINGADDDAKSFSSTASPFQLSAASNHREHRRRAHEAKPSGFLGSEAIPGVDQDTDRTPRAGRPDTRVNPKAFVDGSASGSEGSAAAGTCATAVHSSVQPYILSEPRDGPALDDEVYRMVVHAAASEAESAQKERASPSRSKAAASIRSASDVQEAVSASTSNAFGLGGPIDRGIEEVYNDGAALKGSRGSTWNVRSRGPGGEGAGTARHVWRTGRSMTDMQARPESYNDRNSIEGIMQGPYRSSGAGKTGGRINAGGSGIGSAEAPPRRKVSSAASSIVSDGIGMDSLPPPSDPDGRVSLVYGGRRLGAEKAGPGARDRLGTSGASSMDGGTGLLRPGYSQLY